MWVFKGIGAERERGKEKEERAGSCMYCIGILYGSGKCQNGRELKNEILVERNTSQACLTEESRYRRNKKKMKRKEKNIRKLYIVGEKLADCESTADRGRPWCR